MIPVGTRVSVTDLRKGEVYPGVILKALPDENAYTVRLLPPLDQTIRVGAGFVSPQE